MRIQKQKRFKTAVILGLIAIVILGGAAGFWYFNHKPSSNHVKNSTASKSTSVNYSPATTSQTSAGSSVKADSASNANPSDTVTAQSTSGSTSGKTAVVVTIPSTNQLATTYQITSQIETVTSDGTCTLTLTKSGQNPVIMTASVQAQATISTCEGFSVPLSKLTPGDWQVNLQFDNNNLTGSAATTITVK